MGVNLECYHHFLVFACLWERGWRLRCTHTVVVCVARKLRPCPRYNRHRDRIYLGLLLSLYRGGGTFVLCIHFDRITCVAYLVYGCCDHKLFKAYKRVHAYIPRITFMAHS